MSLTSYDWLMKYKKESSEIIRQLQARIELAAKEAKEQNKNNYTAFIYYHNNLPFVCSIQANTVVNNCIVYRLLPKGNSFSVLAYNPKDQKYYFFRDHFFERYAQRMSLEHKSPSDIVLHFVTLNPVIVFDNTNNLSSKKISKALVHCGFIYCNQKNGNHIINFETLISNYSLNNKKVKETRQLKKMLHFFSF